MTNRARMSTRCMRCRVHADRCICARIVPLEVATRIVVVMHYREWSKTTSTVPLLMQAIPAAEVHIRGETPERLDLGGVRDPARRSLLLWPSDGAAVLTPAYVAADPRPVTLVVPDGTWRQASKIGRREPALCDLPRVTLAADAPTRYRLRSEPVRGGLATYEAVARALGVLEGEPIRRHLEGILDAMVEATLATRSPGRRAQH